MWLNARRAERPGVDTTAGVNTELIACVLYWGVDRRVPGDRIAALLSGLPDWLQREHASRGSDDPMVQSLIVDHLRSCGGG